MNSQNRFTVTHAERRAFDAAINLADGHVRRAPVPAERKVLDELAAIYEESLSVEPRKLETRLVRSLFDVLGQSTPEVDRPPLVFFSGSEALAAIGLSLRASGPRAAVVEPTFDNIPALLERGGIRCEPVNEFTIVDEDALRAVLRRVDTLVMTLPNNPTGFDPDKATLRKIVTACVENNCALVCDCSFRAYSRKNVDLYSILASEPSLEWMVLEDTGKLWASNDLKAGVLTCSPAFYESASQVFHDLVLSISPFVLNLLHNFYDRAHVIGVHQIRTLVETNRTIIRDGLADARVLRPDNSPNPLSVERLFYDHGAYPDQTQLMAELFEAGLAVTGSDGYFWAGSAHEPFVRLALSRDSAVVSDAVDVLARWDADAAETRGRRFRDSA